MLLVAGTAASWACSDIPQAAPELVPSQQQPLGGAAVAGTWTALANQLLPARNLSNPILLTDGTIIAHVQCTSDWYRFTPSNTGSYVNGTWSAIASTVSGYAPLYFGSGVLPDGRVVIEGGEYNDNGGTCVQVFTNQGAIYDPLANTWAPITPPAAWGAIGDGGGIVLPNGTYLQTSCFGGACGNQVHAALLNPSTLSWTATGAGKFGNYEEESLAQLHDGTVLTVDAYWSTGTCGTGSERYTPATGAWTSAGSTVAQQADCDGNNTFEIGPLVMRPDGTAVSFSGRTTGAPQAAIYNTATNTWVAGPVHPSVGGAPYTMADAPAAVLPSGNVLVAMSPGGGSTRTVPLPSPTHFWELDANNTFTLMPDNVGTTSFNSFQENLLLLPTGQVMAFTIGDTSSVPPVQLYTPGGAPLDAWRPTVSSVPASLAPGQTYTVSGTQLNGRTEGTYYGDDTNASTNFPLVRITNTASGHVSYARTFSHSSRSIAPGATASSSFTVPAGIDTGAATLEVVANGIPSFGVNVTVGTVDVLAAMVSPTPGSVLPGSSVTFSWTTGSGVSQYYLYVGSSPGAADFYAASQGLATSGAVTGLPTDGRTLYVRLWSLTSLGWQFFDYTYTAAVVAVPASIYSPAPGSVLPGSSVTFSWTTGSGVSQYYLYVGSSPGAADFYAASQGLATSGAVTGLPTDGRVLYVRLWSFTNLGWQFRDYTYTAFQPVCDSRTGTHGQIWVNSAAYTQYVFHGGWCSFGRTVPAMCWQGTYYFYQYETSETCTNLGSGGTCTDPDAVWWVTCQSSVDCIYDCSGQCLQVGC